MAKEKLDAQKQIILMLGYLCINNDKLTSLPQKIDVLDRFNLTDSDIAIICGSKEQSVRDARLKLKKKK